jgi:hypothetical protein
MFEADFFIDKLNQAGLNYEYNLFAWHHCEGENSLPPDGSEPMGPPADYCIQNSCTTCEAVPNLEDCTYDFVCTSDPSVSIEFYSMKYISISTQVIPNIGTICSVYEQCWFDPCENYNLIADNIDLSGEIPTAGEGVDIVTLENFFNSNGYNITLNCEDSDYCTCTELSVMFPPFGGDCTLFVIAYSYLIFLVHPIPNWYPDWALSSINGRKAYNPM